MALVAQITVGSTLVIEVDADPEGGITAPAGSLALDSANAKLYQNTDGATAWVPVGIDGTLYGDGSDGAVSLGSNTTLTRDMFYTTLDTNGFDIITDGFRIFANVSVTIGSGDDVGATGDSGGAGSAGAGGSSGAGATGNALVAGADGGAGGFNSATGSAGVSKINALGGDGGAGGNSGAGDSGGAAGTTTAPVAGAGTVRARPSCTTGFLFGSASPGPAAPGAGGGGGGGDISSGGGGGAGGGGTVLIAAPLINLVGTITADGGLAI